jgi:hypothetical protein
MVDKYRAVNFTTDISKTTSRFLLLLDYQAPTSRGVSREQATSDCEQPQVGNPFPSQLSGRLFGSCFIKDANP